MWNNESLREFGKAIQSLIDGADLSREQTCRCFKQILLGEQPDLQQGALLAALTAKGETPAEIAGVWQAVMEVDTIEATLIAAPLVENSGTGMDRLKTFNVSSAAAIVAAAGGARMARHGARALTSFCGTVDILEAVGIDVDCGVGQVQRSIEQAGIGIFNGMSPAVHPRGLGRILSQIRFGSTLNIAASLANPARPTHALRGVYSRDMMPAVATVMREIGYQRGMVVHGTDSSGENAMDELSTLGQSHVLEFFPDGRHLAYVLHPEEVGIARGDYAALAPTGNLWEEAVRFLKVIAGVDHPACIDITCLNAGAILYLLEKADTITAGIACARELIATGQALEKLSHWAAVQCDSTHSGLGRLAQVAKAAHIEIKLP
jgi:anthranilate phosphoribosyltransferase